MSGQMCAALTRIIVTRNRHDELVEALAYAFSHAVIGDPFDGGTQMGPLAMRRQRDRVEGYIAKGTVGHNALRGDPAIAFGGFKQSGIGREGGVEGLTELLETKLIILSGPPTDEESG
jgi:acyl-CoA reductase-like NAD-dependent aldehyde dehydrogenase